MQSEGNAWYVQFPRGYWLYEKSKHLWVSGYPIKAKLFKSPQEFAAHIIWLLSSSQEYKDCCCVHCNNASAAKLAPSVDDTGMSTPTLPPSKPEKPTPKVTPVPLPTIPGQTPPARQSAPANPPASQPQSAPPQQAASSQAQAAAQQQQSVGWALQSPMVFRSGELVWYQNGSTWRLGVIGAQHAGNNEVVPLGFGMVIQPNVTKSDADMRPFQAFSVPPVTIPELNDKVFDEVPWELTFRGNVNDAAKRDLLLLDASKLAASKIDYSYSLWSPISEDPQARSITYYGCFMGAERVEIGDCLRIRQLPTELNIAAEQPIMGLRFIFTSKDYPGALFFHGHIYKQAEPGTDPAAMVPEDQLPIPLRDESSWRNQVSGSPTKRHGWILLRENTVLKEHSIRGRFYPSHRLMPILNPAGFQAALAQGQVDDQYPYLNSRMDGAGRYVGRRQNRIDTAGASIPQGMRLVFEPHIREEGYGGGEAGAAPAPQQQ